LNGVISLVSINRPRNNSRRRKGEKNRLENERRKH